MTVVMPMVFLASSVVVFQVAVRCFLVGGIVDVVFFAMQTMILVLAVFVVATGRLMRLVVCRGCLEVRLVLFLGHLCRIGPI